MGNNDQQKKLCGFDKQPCIEDKCVHWTQIALQKPGMIAPQQQGMCVFQAILLLASSPKPEMQKTPFPNIRKG